MTESEMLQAAREAVRNPRPSSVIAIDAAALQAANNLPRVVDLSSLVGFLSGAPQQAQNSNQQFQNASNESGGYYGTALNNLVNSTGSGSPAAATFGAEQQAALQPKFDQQNQQLTASNAAQGIGSSGSGLYNNGQLAADQSATLAGAIAPLYSTALQQYGQGNLNQAAQQSGLVGQGAGAANQAYGQSIQDFYGAAETAGTGIPAGNTNPYSGQSTSSNTVPGSGSVGPNTATATYGSYAY